MMARKIQGRKSSSGLSIFKKIQYALSSFAHKKDQNMCKREIEHRNLTFLSLLAKITSRNSVELHCFMARMFVFDYKKCSARIAESKRSFQPRNQTC